MYLHIYMRNRPVNPRTKWSIATPTPGTRGATTPRAWLGEGAAGWSRAERAGHTSVSRWPPDREMRRGGSSLLSGWGWGERPRCFCFWWCAAADLCVCVGRDGACVVGWTAVNLLHHTQKTLSTKKITIHHNTINGHYQLLKKKPTRGATPPAVHKRRGGSRRCSRAGYCGG